MPSPTMIKTELIDSIKKDLERALKVEPLKKSMSTAVSENAALIRKLRSKGYSFEAIAEIFNKSLESENQEIKPASLKALLSKNKPATSKRSFNASSNKKKDPSDINSDD